MSSTFCARPMESNGGIAPSLDVCIRTCASFLPGKHQLRPGNPANVEVELAGLLRFLQVLLDQRFHSIETGPFGSDAMQRSLQLDSGKTADVRRCGVNVGADPAQCCSGRKHRRIYDRMMKHGRI